MIKVSFFISYDWVFLKESLPVVYADADQIYLSVDQNRISWTGNSFDLPKEFFEWIDKYDIDKKIIMYSDTFYLKHLSPMENEKRQRKMVYEFMGHEGWQIHLEPDEFFLEFKKFTQFLKRQTKKPLAIGVNFITIFKKLEKHYILIDKSPEKFDEIKTIATNFYPTHGRGLASPGRVYSPFFVLHNSWGRSENEILQKINNWGHNQDFDIESFFKFWSCLDVNNYKYFHNFHPIAPAFWPGLKLVEADSITELISNLKKNKQFSLSRFYQIKRNSKIYLILQQINKKYNYPLRILRWLSRKFLKLTN